VISAICQVATNRCGCCGHGHFPKKWASQTKRMNEIYSLRVHTCPKRCCDTSFMFGRARAHARTHTHTQTNKQTNKHTHTHETSTKFPGMKSNEDAFSFLSNFPTHNSADTYNSNTIYSVEHDHDIQSIQTCILHDILLLPY
jgi:hypothetical protein